LGGGDGVGGEDGLESSACFCHGGWGQRQESSENQIRSD
jgi:hypothetical protein